MLYTYLKNRMVLESENAFRSHFIHRTEDIVNVVLMETVEKDRKNLILKWITALLFVCQWNDSS
jgi:hypothetical protein